MCNALATHHQIYMKIIDLHQDLLLHIRSGQEIGQNRQTDFAMLEAADAKIVVATAFPFPPDENYFDPITNELIEQDFLGYIEHCAANPNWRIVKTRDDVAEILKTEGARGILMHIEGLNVFENDWTRLEKWRELGLRSIGPVWNLTNVFGGGTKDATTGLTAVGRELIYWLQANQMIVDCAHMNPPTFWEAVKEIRGPIIISHGNSCALCASERNYSDEQLKLVAERGGICGVFFPQRFIVAPPAKATMADVVKHFSHLVNVMGEDCVAIGSDFGGIVSGTVAGFDSLERLPILWEALEQAGFSSEQIEKIAYKNAARILQEVLPKN